MLFYILKQLSDLSNCVFSGLHFTREFYEEANGPSPLSRFPIC